MCAAVDVTDKVQNLVADIIRQNNFNATALVKYSQGSAIGDGYTSKTAAVDIVDGDKSLNIFIKSLLNFDESLGVNILFKQETLFYKTVYPTYLNFLQEKMVKDGFHNAPRCYGFSEEEGHEIIALENLKTQGYVLFNQYKHLTDQQLKLILRTFAQFHAISFALKDQRKELHEGLCDKCPYIFHRLTGFEKLYARVARDFVLRLDAVEDIDILDKCNNLEARVQEEFLNFPNNLNTYSILTKFDCWINNMMVLYEDNEKELAKDVMLVDWQCITRGSPIHDIGPLFYSTASKDAVNNYKDYMELYYDELSKRIRELGSDPDAIYPHSAFEKDQTNYSFYCFGFALTGIKGMLTNRENAPDLTERMKANDTSALENLFTDSADNIDEWMLRTKHLARHFIALNIL